jgi:hypothetical protein
MGVEGFSNMVQAYAFKIASNHLKILAVSDGLWYGANGCG